MTYPLPWVKLEKYAEITGDTVEAAKHRIKSGKWQHGDQCKVVDGRIWVDLRAVERWIENWSATGAVRAANRSRDTQG
jgi:hypothetical protein